MKILVIGATRGIGLQLVQQALEGGHSVTALVRKPSNPINDAQLRVVVVDVFVGRSVEEAMTGQDVGCSTVGVKLGRGPITVFSEGIRNESPDWCLSLTSGRETASITAASSMTNCFGHSC